MFLLGGGDMYRTIPFVIVFFFIFTTVFFSSSAGKMEALKRTALQQGEFSYSRWRKNNDDGEIFRDVLSTAGQCKQPSFLFVYFSLAPLLLLRRSIFEFDNQ
jgi:uncharacterized membrane protein